MTAAGDSFDVAARVDPRLVADLRRVREVLDSVRGAQVAHLYGPHSIEDQMYIQSAPIEQAAGTAVREALAQLGFHVTDVDPTRDFMAELASCDFVFNNLHGPLGEDGTVQAMLDYAGIRYSGSGVLASAAALHKPTAKLLARGVGIDTPEGVVVRSRSDVAPLPGQLGPPWIVKPAVGGSSVGLTVVQNESELPDAFTAARRVGSDVLVESYVTGRDLTIGVLDVLEGRESVPLAVVEVITSAGTYDDDAKLHGHWRDAVRYECPASLSDACRSAVERQSVLMHRALGCRGYSRIDWRLDEGERLWFLEVNTNPGLSRRGNFALSAAGAGLVYDDLIMAMAATAWPPSGMQEPSKSRSVRAGATGVAHAACEH